METVYLAPEDRLEELRAELGDAVRAVHGRLVVAAGPAREVLWAQNIWRDARRIPIASIKDGARRLRAIQRNWWLHPTVERGRAKLIAEHLPHVSAKPLAFPEPAPTAPLGGWTLLDRDTLLASPDTSTPFPDGEVRFVEDKQGPPSRAYLKLWEALTRMGLRPGLGQRCVDLGAAPGGWTWVLAELGAEVLAVDRAPLDPRLVERRNVTAEQGDAFALAPRPVDWLVSDVICYPARTLELVRRWRPHARHLVCTVKLQSTPDSAAIDALRNISGARVVHLFHNKHELTLMI